MSHQPHDIFENRKQFQLERMILFSDAVFAIVITLLVIDIKVPETNFGTLHAHQLTEHLIEILPRFIGFVVSFAVVGLFWTTHHRMFGYVKDYNGALIWLNLGLLFFIACLPFTTSLVSQYGYLDLAYSIYSINLALIGFMSYFIWRYIGNPDKHLSVGLEDAHLRRYSRTRSFLIALIFLSGALLCLFNSYATSMIGRFIFFLIFPMITILKKVYKVKDKQ